MMSLKSKIEKLQQELEKSVVTRRDVFNKRTEKWQESGKGERHYETTEILMDWYNQLGDWIDEIETF